MKKGHQEKEKRPIILCIQLYWSVSDTHSYEIWLSDRLMLWNTESFLRAAYQKKKAERVKSSIV